MENTSIAAPKLSAKDFFLHLLGIVTLYASAASLISLLFNYVNTAFPDNLYDGYTYAPSYAGAIRFALSTLIVVFPTYLIVSWLLEKAYAAAPEKRDLKVRKWLIYFTLFAAGLILIGDLVSIIYNLLGGELTIRFGLKALSIFLVIGSVFGYYLWDIKRHKTE